MKKIATLILSVLILSGCFSISSTAQNIKISLKLQQMTADSDPQDVITIAVWLKGFTDEISSMPGYPDTDICSAELELAFTEQQERLYPLVFGGIEVDPLYRGAGSLVVVNLKVADISAVAQNEHVKFVDLWTFGANRPDTEVDQQAVDDKIDPELLTKLTKSAPNQIIDVYVSLNGFNENAAMMPGESIYQKRRELGFLFTAKRFFVYPVLFDGLDVTVSEPVSNINYFQVEIKAQDIKKIAADKIVDYIGLLYDFPEVSHSSGDEGEISYGNWLFMDKFLKQYSVVFDGLYGVQGITDYKELYYHKDKNDEMDWALVCSDSDIASGVEMNILIADRLFIGNPSAPFATKYGLFDAKKKKFIDMSEVSVSDYDGLRRVFNDLGSARLIGDIDRDDELTILDCTMIQWCSTQICDWPKNDVIDFSEGKMVSIPEQLTYYSDFDRDGERDIVDATKLQRYVTLID